jgi:hypothetical protein
LPGSPKRHRGLEVSTHGSTTTDQILHLARATSRTKVHPYPIALQNRCKRINHGRSWVTTFLVSKGNQPVLHPTPSPARAGRPDAPRRLPFDRAAGEHARHSGGVGRDGRRTPGALSASSSATWHHETATPTRVLEASGGAARAAAPDRGHCCPESASVKRVRWTVRYSRWQVITTTTQASPRVQPTRTSVNQ